MTIRKFLAPNIAVLITLSIFWFAGVESIVSNPNDDETNIRKFIRAQNTIVQNYFGDTSFSKLYKEAMIGMVKAINDSTSFDFTNTPVDTTKSYNQVTSISSAVAAFEDSYYFVANNFTDKDMTKMTEAAIIGMFNSLDPHSIYIEPEDSEQIQEEFAGKFQGIGVQFNIIQDSITVITAISGGPSDRLGIRSGDRIVAIEDSSSVGYTNEQVLRKLRGPKGSEVDVTIVRPGERQALNFTITRDDIPIYTVDTSYLLDEQTGYIKINRFAATTHSEFLSAVEELNAQGMERLVLDLRGNPGGFLGQAIAISEEFFPRGTKIVSTSSKHRRFNSEYYSRKDGTFKDKPVIILVNEGAASASEIVSGAIQDHDRGLIVGRRTFGKGLVQQQYGLDDNSNIRVTISRYLTPSGRLIQKPFTEGGGEEYAYELIRRNNDASTDATEFVEHIADSLIFQTDAGRKVYGGGGIVPDYIIQEDTTTSAFVINFMIRKRGAFDYVRSFLDENGDKFRAEWESDFERFRTDFEWSAEDIEGIKNHLVEKNMIISDDIEKPRFSARADSLFIPEGHFEEVAWMSLGRMKAELARQVWTSKEFFPIVNDVFDTTLKEAMQLWDAVERLAALSQNSSIKIDG